MPMSRRSPRRARKQLKAELDRLTVPVARVEPKPSGENGKKATQAPDETGRDIAAEAEAIRQMIEASYT